MANELILIFDGSDMEADILKNKLEGIDIRVHLKSETKAAVSAGFGSTGLCSVYIKQDDLFKASEVIRLFKSRNPK